ncbi:nucleotidyl transferase AbiEii/AbiGii toxin family protein [Bacteroides stercoris]|uniref:nucleotidyl transferase AbiEii/AbiGii toxin family protein n=1 Tax=Bacteroides stercoris TaxID=46506 RepID=UPI00359C3DBD
MLYLETVESSTLELLKKLQRLPVLEQTRLVGGTALALQLGHRKSIDLDFFGTIDCEAEYLRESIAGIASLTILKESPHIHIYIVDGIKVDIVNYKYPWLDDVVLEQGLRLASVSDIAAMKITAIIGRGTKKDFIDIAFLLHHFSLEEILHFYAAKYNDSSVFMAMKSLAYFDDAEADPMPDMFVNQSWQQVKAHILSKIS